MIATKKKAKSKSRALTYIRCSTSDQDESLPSQLDWAIRRAVELGVAFSPTQKDLKYALAEGLTEVGDLYLDPAVTGADMKRPGFLAFNERAVEDTSITHVLLWSRDRFARPEETSEAMKMEKAILFAGKDVVVAQGRSLSARKRNDHQLCDDFILMYEYAAAYAYRVDLAYKVLRGQGKNASAGLTNGGRAPYGMRRAICFTETGKLDFLRDGELRRGPGMVVVIVPGESEEDLKKLAVVKEIHDLYSRDHGLPQVARILNERGVPSPDFGRKRKIKGTKTKRAVSGKWGVSNARGVLEQPLYMASYAWGRRAEGSLLRFDQASSANSRDLLPEEREPGAVTAKKVVKRDWEAWFTAALARPFDPIVDPDQWKANYEKLRRRGSVGGQRGVPRCRDESRYPLRVLCGSCGHAMSGTPKYGRYVYTCSTYSNSHGTDCAHNWCDRDIVVGFALRGIQHVLKDPRNADRLRKLLHDLLAEQSTSGRPSEKELANLEARLLALEQARRKADRDRRLAEDEIERTDAEATYAECLKETKLVKGKLNVLKRRLGHVAPKDVDAEVDQMVALLDEIGAVVQEADRSTLREVFTSLGATVTIAYAPGRVGNRLNLPVSAELRLGAPLGVLGDVGRGERI